MHFVWSGENCVYNARAESLVEKGKEEKSKSHISLFSLSLSLSFFLYPRITWSFHQQDPSPEKVRSFLEWQSKDTYIMISRIPAA
jgi:hypothetical protein